MLLICPKCGARNDLLDIAIGTCKGCAGKIELKEADE